MDPDQSSLLFLGAASFVVRCLPVSYVTHILFFFLSVPVVVVFSLSLARTRPCLPSPGVAVIFYFGPSATPSTVLVIFL